MAEPWAHFSDFDGVHRVSRLDIDMQRAEGWPKFHPEDFCHRCGGRNLSWWCDSILWNEVMRPEGPDSPWRWNEIICPQCFSELAEAKFGPASFTFTIDPATTGGREFVRQTSPSVRTEGEN